MGKVKLEVGKRYVNRNDEVIKIVDHIAGVPWCYRDHHGSLYKSNGVYSVTGLPSPNDLIMELTNPGPQSAATKHDTGKPPLSLVPREGLEYTARAFEFGANKYGRNNYKRGMQWSRMCDAALRHLTAFANGEPQDPESGHSHIAHALASLNMLAYHIENHPTLNDIYETEDSKDE